MDSFTLYLIKKNTNILLACQTLFQIKLTLHDKKKSLLHLSLQMTTSGCLLKTGTCSLATWNIKNPALEDQALMTVIRFPSFPGTLRDVAFLCLLCVCESRLVQISGFKL